MTFRVILSRPEYIILIHLNGNKNDKDKGIINAQAWIAHLCVSLSRQVTKRRAAILALGAGLRCRPWHLGNEAP